MPLSFFGKKFITQNKNHISTADKQNTQECTPCVAIREIDVRLPKIFLDGEAFLW